MDQEPYIPQEMQIGKKWELYFKRRIKVKIVLVKSWVWYSAFQTLFKELILQFYTLKEYNFP